MSANPDVLRSSEEESSGHRTVFSPAVFSEHSDWTPGGFAGEQIRSLVRRVFFTNDASPPKHVTFSAMEEETDAYHVCDQVGWALALETGADVAVVGGEQSLKNRLRPHPRFGGRVTIKSWSTQKAINLWHVPQRGGRECGTQRYWLSFLAELRSEFEYAVIHAPVAGMSSETALLGQLADGIILVLGARCRKATARKIKETLVAGRCRILGTVLNERAFPVPEWLYRRL
jgi:hypothetical protein